MSAVSAPSHSWTGYTAHCIHCLAIQSTELQYEPQYRQLTPICYSAQRHAAQAVSSLPVLQAMACKGRSRAQSKAMLQHNQLSCSCSQFHPCIPPQHSPPGHQLSLAWQTLPTLSGPSLEPSHHHLPSPCSLGSMPLSTPSAHPP